MDNKFKIEMDDGTSITANVVINFEYLNNLYCIYSIESDDGVSLYCARNVDGNLVRIVDKDEIDFVNTVVNKIVGAVNSRGDIDG